jgi:hypothetical protein
MRPNSTMPPKRTKLRTLSCHRCGATNPAETPYCYACLEPVPPPAPPVPPPTRTTQCVACLQVYPVKFGDGRICSACVSRGFQWVHESETYLETVDQTRTVKTEIVRPNPKGAIGGAIVGGLLFGPIGATLGAYLNSEKKETISNAVPVQKAVRRTKTHRSLKRKCPACKEFVQPDAVVCRFCQTMLAEGDG